MAFDPDEALDAAMKVFWRHGYEGTSLAMLLEAMGINRSSCYATFGDKETLFRRVIERYDQRACAASAAFDQPTARQAVEMHLMAATELVDPTLEGGGCMLVTSCLAGGSDSASVRSTLADVRERVIDTWTARFERARREGDLSKEVEPHELAMYVVSVTFGLTVLARTGASRDELRRVVALALEHGPF